MYFKFIYISASSVKICPTENKEKLKTFIYEMQICEHSFFHRKYRISVLYIYCKEPRGGGGENIEVVDMYIVVFLFCSLGHIPYLHSQSLVKLMRFILYLSKFYTVLK